MARRQEQKSKLMRVTRGNNPRPPSIVKWSKQASVCQVPHISRIRPSKQRIEVLFLFLQQQVEASISFASGVFVMQECGSARRKKKDAVPYRSAWKKTASQGQDNNLQIFTRKYTDDKEQTARTHHRWADGSKALRVPRWKTEERSARYTYIFSDLVIGGTHSTPAAQPS